MNKDSAGPLMAELATDAAPRRWRTTSYVPGELSHAQDLLDERPRTHDTHSLPRTEVSDVVRDEQARSCAIAAAINRHVLRVSASSRAFTVVRRRLLAPVRDRKPPIRTSASTQTVSGRRYVSAASRGTTSR